jgi:hypothetical protein
MGDGLYAQVRARPLLGLLAVALVDAALLSAVWPRRDAPPAEVHSWRQSLGASVARSYRCGQPFLEPRADACAAAPGGGVTSMELPLYAWGMARLAPALGPHGGERAIGIAATLLLPLALWAMARRLLVRLPAAAREGGAVLAAAIPLASPLAVGYGATLLPDVPAHALAAAGAALALSGGERGRVGRLVAGSLLVSVGLATKLAAAPIAALAGAALLARALRARGAARQDRLRMVAAHAALVLSVPAAWYLGWDRVLAAREACALFWMPGLDGRHALAGVGLDLPRHAALALSTLFGPVGGAAVGALAGVALVAARGARLALAAGALAGGALLAVLGWHAAVHEYDALALLAPAALAAGAGLGAAIATLRRTWRGAAAAIVVLLAVPAFVAALPGVRERTRPESEKLLLLGRDLDLLLPPDEPLLAPGAGDDPRASYFGARATWNDAPVACDGSAALDCALVLWDGRPPCAGLPASVFLPDRTVTCGLAGGDPARIRARLAGTLRGTPREARGLGRYLGYDAAHRAGGPARALLFFEAPLGPIDRGALRTALPTAWPKVEPAPGAIYAVGLDLPGPGAFRAEVAGLVVEGETEDAGEIENRCVEPRR